jgi:hypothetical protein
LVGIIHFGIHCLDLPRRNLCPICQEPISGSLASGGPSEAPPNVKSDLFTTPRQDIGYPPREIVPEASIVHEIALSPASSTTPAYPTLPGPLSIPPSSSTGSPSLPSASSDGAVSHRNVKPAWNLTNCTVDSYSPFSKHRTDRFSP